MLGFLRSSIGGWVAKILIGLLVMSFAVWGISGSMFQGVGSNVVQVGDTKVGLLDYRLAYNQQVNSLSRQFGTRLNREQANAFGVEQTVLAQMVSGAVLDENARKMGLGLSEKELAKLIGDDPAFRDASGNFSRSQLQLSLNQIGMREDDYIRNRSSVAVRSQIIEGAARGISVPQALLDAYQQYQNEKRVFDYVTIDESAVVEKPVPTDQDLSKYYDDNKATYVAPEYRKLTIVKLEAEDIADESAITEDEVKKEYEAKSNQFTKQEERQIEQLVISKTDKAQDYADRLDAGEDFAKIVEEDGKKLSDISLGKFKKSDLPDQTVADAAFGLELNKPSGLVQGLFGPVILRVTEITEESKSPYVEVKDQIRKDLSIVKAADELFDMHDRLEDERAAGDTLEEAAKKVGLTARIIEATSSRGQDKEGNQIDPLPNQITLLREAFDVAQGVETDPISLSGGGFVWYDVADVTLERQKPLEEVKEDVEKDWGVKRTSELVAEIAENIQKRVSGGEPFEKVAAELLPEDSLGQKGAIQKTVEVDRRGTHQELNNQAIVAGFALAEGKIGAADMGGGKFAVLVPSQIVTSDENAATDEIKTQFNNSLANDLVTQLVGNLQAGEDVQVNQQAIDAALSYGQHGM